MKNGKNVKKSILGVPDKHLRYNAVIVRSKHGFMRRRCCIMNLISFYEVITHIVGQEKAVDGTCLDFSKDWVSDGALTSPSNGL